METAPDPEKVMSTAATIPFDSRYPAATRTFGPWGGTMAAAAVKPLDPDLQLVTECLSGTEAAWEELIRVHTRRVYSVCYRFTGTGEEAQDLTQEVFLRVFRTLRSFRAGEGTFSVWLNRLTRNLLIDHYRRSRQDRATDSIEDQLPRIEESTAVTSRADGMLAGREASDLLQGALQRLSPELRETVILRDVEELEYREIAQILNIPEGTVKSRINRGRAELARLLRRFKVAV
ncbi:MAG: sigma-70 family RNA polymerase sigma factor [Bryobacteraceae bacterium]|nr:sigma-70 family RNA polymerase sigma factor [Bryobacteraceae bacterium]